MHEAAVAARAIAAAIAQIRIARQTFPGITQSVQFHQVKLQHGARRVRAQQHVTFLRKASDHLGAIGTHGGW